MTSPKKTLLITGATSGIGLQLAHDYLKLGWQVIACGRNKTVLATLQQQGMLTLCFDVSDPIAMDDQINTLETQIQQLDCLILNAGICRYVEDGEVSFELLEQTMAINVFAPIALLNRLKPLLAQSVAPQVALMSSASVYLPFPRAEAYGASKIALRYMGHVLANTLKKQRISVSTIILGFIDTPLTQQNTFDMPMLSHVQDASLAIIKGLQKRKTEICFPFLFCKTLSFMALFPISIQLRLMARLMDKAR